MDKPIAAVVKPDVDLLRPAPAVVLIVGNRVGQGGGVAAVLLLLEIDGRISCEPLLRPVHRPAEDGAAAPNEVGGDGDGQLFALLQIAAAGFFDVRAVVGDGGGCQGRIIKAGVKFAHLHTSRHAVDIVGGDHIEVVAVGA